MADTFSFIVITNNRSLNIYISTLISSTIVWQDEFHSYRGFGRRLENEFAGQLRITSSFLDNFTASAKSRIQNNHNIGYSDKLNK